MSRLFKITAVLAVVALVFTSCDKRKRNLQYMPDMYVSDAGEPYAESKVFANGIEAQKPVSNTISRGHIPYEYPNTNEGYEEAKSNLKSPLTAEDLDSNNEDTGTKVKIKIPIETTK